MAIKIGLECNRAERFKTRIDKCLSFCVENRGTTIIYISFDDGDSEIDVQPGDTFREFAGGSGELYTGEMSVRFGSKPADADPLEPVINKVNVIKNLFYCNN